MGARSPFFHSEINSLSVRSVKSESVNHFQFSILFCFAVLYYNIYSFLFFSALVCSTVLFSALLYSSLLCVLSRQEMPISRQEIAISRQEIRNTGRIIQFFAICRRFTRRGTPGWPLLPFGQFTFWGRHTLRKNFIVMCAARLKAAQG